MNKQQLIERRILAQHRIVAERLDADPDAVLGQARSNLARWTERYSPDERPVWLEEWTRLLDGPIDVVRKLLISSSENATRLRASSPFAGVLTARERWELYRRLDDEAR